MKAIYTVSTLFVCLVSMAQVGVNTATPDPSSVLDVVATDKGMLVPRVNLPDINVTMLDGINTAAAGLLIYNTNVATVGGNGVGFYYFNGTVWAPLTTTATDDQTIDHLSLVGTTLRLSLENDGQPAQTLNLASIDTDDQTIDAISLVGTTLGISLQNDGQPPQTVNLSGLQDHDWYEVGGTTPANAISDDIYSWGDVSIGKSTAATAQLDVAALGKNITMDLTNIYTLSAAKIGLRNQLTIDGSFGGTGVYNFLTGNSASKFGYRNNFYSIASGPKSEIGLESLSGSTGETYFTGTKNTVAPPTSNTGPFIGLHNDVLNYQQGNTYGIYNNFNALGNTSSIYGLYNNLAGTGNASVTGVYTSINTNGTGTKYGEYIYIPNSIGGTHYGLHAEVTKFGSFAGYFLGRVSFGTTTSNNYIFPASRGTSGQIMQTDATGNLSWVTPAITSDDQNLTTATLTGTTLNLGIESGTGTSIDLSPLQDGTGTDSQTVDTFALVGNTLGISLQNDGQPVHTVNLSGLSDHDWHEVGGTNPADNITDDIYTMGAVSIGQPNSASAKVDILSNNKAITLNLFNHDPMTSGIKMGIQNQITAAGNSTTTGIQNSIMGDGNYKFGIRNHFSSPTPVAFNDETGIQNLSNSTGSNRFTGTSNISAPIANNTGVFIGVENFATNATAGPVMGVFNNISPVTNNSELIGVNNNMSGVGNAQVKGLNTTITTSGTGTKYGDYIRIPGSVGGTHYGLYSDVTKAGSFAGYFLGDVSIGTTTTNNYILPASRGTNGQIMRTNGAGVVSWVNLPAFSDNQNLLTPTLTGTTLNLGIENGTGTTIDLSPLQDGTGTDDQNLTPATLSGTNLTLGIENGSGVSVNLGPLLNSVAANNGLNVDAGTVQLGGPLIEDTTIPFAANTMRYNLNGTGDFIVQDTGTDMFRINDDGTAFLERRFSIGEADNANAAVNVSKNSSNTNFHVELEQINANEGARLRFTNQAETNSSWVMLGRADDTIADSFFTLNALGHNNNIIYARATGQVGINRIPTTNELEVGGNASKATAGAWLANSDARLKKDIITIAPEKALEKLLSLRGVTYKWNDDKTGIQRPESIRYGFVAQEIQQVFPEKVKADAQGYLQTAYGDYDALMVQSMKAIVERLEKLEAENAQLRAIVQSKNQETASTER